MKMTSKFIDAIKEHGIKLLGSEFHADKVGKYADTFTEQDLQQLLSELEQAEKKIKIGESYQCEGCGHPIFTSSYCDHCRKLLES